VQHVLHSHAQERRVSASTKQCFTVTSRCFTNGGGQGYAHHITIYVQCRHCSTRGDSQRICRASSEEHGCTEAESDGSIGRVHEPWSKHHSAKPFGVQHDFLGFAFRRKISEMVVVMWLAVVSGQIAVVVIVVVVTVAGAEISSGCDCVSGG